MISFKHPSISPHSITGILINQHITVLSAAEATGYNIQYLRRLLRSGALKGVKIGQMWLIEMDALEAYLKYVESTSNRRCGPSYQSGMRVVKPDGSMEVYFDEKEGFAGLDRAVDFVKAFDSAYDGLVRGMLAPERIETQTLDVLRASKQYSDALGVTCCTRLL